jgi:uncharacterized membrane protein
MNMLDRGLAWVVHVCPRLLFAASIVMLIAGIVNFVSFATGDVYYFATTEYVFQSYFGPAAWLLFGAVLTDRLAGG